MFSRRHRGIPLPLVCDFSFVILRIGIAFTKESINSQTIQNTIVNVIRVNDI